MANALIVRRNTQLAKAEKALRAAQYVRMSTDYQKYSIENQAAAIGAYAESRNLKIVRTYRDAGESGLRLKNRAGLTQLLDDVQSDRADFDHILVYDVSRWGRFQNADESAHYEFICKQAGITVQYCAEQFENDGSMLSSIVKNIKRVMAAEYSRELSTKVHAGACRIVSMGYKSGGRTCYGLERLLVDEKSQPKSVLKDGERKYCMADHVRLRPGIASEVEIVRWVFSQFLELKSETAIARELNRRNVSNGSRKPWDRGHIGRLLRNENYVGNIIYNRRSKKLGEKNTYNPPRLWVRGDGFVEPIIERDVFDRARKIIAERRVDLTEPEMLVRLRKTLAKRGRLSPAIIDETIGLPCTATYLQHFGSLREAYRLVGYTSHRNCEYLDSRERWSELMSNLGTTTTARLRKIGCDVTSNGLVNGSIQLRQETISFRLAKWQPGLKENHAPYWSIKRRASMPTGWVIAIRLTERNTDVLDYILLRSTDFRFPLLRFSEKARVRRGPSTFEDFDSLLRSLIQKITIVRRAASAKPRSSKRPSKIRRS